VRSIRNFNLHSNLDNPVSPTVNWPALAHDVDHHPDAEESAQDWPQGLCLAVSPEGMYADVLMVGLLAPTERSSPTPPPPTAPTALLTPTAPENSISVC